MPDKTEVPCVALFESYRLGHLTLKNRCVMAPMTRSRAVTHSPDASTVAYYQQRASAGLIITEGTVISRQGRGYLWTPGIYTAEQIAGWKKVTEAVHQAGGKIFVQLWHVGRMSHVTLQENGAAPVTSVESQIRDFKVFAWNDQGQAVQLPASRARALEDSEIHAITDDFVNASRAAVEAGFDGVEIHAANGYLLDQFINGGLNTRTDEYGGKSITNRLRFVLETVDAVIKEIGAERVGVRISPGAHINDIPAYDDENEPQIMLARELAKRNIIYLHLNDIGAGENIQADIKKAFNNTLILCGEYNRDRGEAAIKEGEADLIAFGRPFISNPDLVARMQHNWPVVPTPKSVFYGGGDAGYIDFPAFKPS